MVKTPTESRGLEDLAAGLGFRHIHTVRMTVGAGRATAEVSGIARRYPSTIRVSVRTAARLVAAGAPLSYVDRELRA